MSDQRQGNDRFLGRFEAMRIDWLFCWLAEYGGLKASSPSDEESSQETTTRSRRSWRSRPNSGLAVALWSACVVSVLWIGFAAIEGRLSASKPVENNVRPALHSLVTAIPGFIEVHAHAKYHSFPLFADTASWLLAMSSVVTFGLLMRQWKIMAEVLPRLVDRGAIKIEDQKAFVRLLDRLNRLMASKITMFVLAALSAGTVVFIYKGFAHLGLYETLAPMSNPHHRHSWALMSYGGWWASAHGGAWWGFAVFMPLLFAYLYYLLAQYFAGAMWVFFTWQGGKHVSFGFDLMNVDGYYGWRPLRDLMITVYWSILIQVLALLPLLHQLAQPSWTYLAIPFALFAFFNPIYVLTPLVLVTPRLRRRREHLLETAAGGNVGDDEPAASLAGPAFRSQVDDYAQDAQTFAYLRGMPAFPIRGRELAFGAVTYGLPVAALIWRG